MEKVYIQDNFRKKLVGRIDKNKKIFTRQVKDKGIFRKANAIGIDGEIFSTLLYPDNYTIIIDLVDRNPIERLVVSAKQFQEKGFFLDYLPYRKQIFLSCDNFERPTIK